MNAIQNFAFEDHLVRVVTVQDETWFVGKDVCDCLDLKNHRTTLDLLDEDEKGVHTVDTLGGGQAMITVSEPGVYRLVFRSRKPEAERFKRWLAHDVLPQIRRTGLYAPDGFAERITLEAEAPLMSRVEAVRLAARLWGKERARSLWAKLGLPSVPPASQWEGEGEARACLAHLAAAVPQAGDGRTMRQLILDALDGDENARATCLYSGVRIADDGESFGVANVAEALAEIYEGTQWQGRGWRLVLARLKDAVKGDTQKVGRPSRPSRLVWLPASALDSLTE